jgi:hypothetical protein
MRGPIIGAVRATPVLEGLAAAGGLALLAVGLAVLALRGRLRDA